MKKSWFTFFFLVGVFAACNKETQKDNEIADDVIPVTYIQASCEDGSTKGSVGEDAAFTWNTGDKIAVYADGGYKISDPLDETFNGQTTATFSFSGVNAFADNTRANFAVYPSDLVYEWVDSEIYTDNVTAETLDITLPTDYNLSDIMDNKARTPMIASNSPGSGLSFMVLCPLLRLTLRDMPADCAKNYGFEVWFDVNEVAGNFQMTDVRPGETAVSQSNAHSYNTSGFWIQNDLDGDFPRDVTINLPVPVGAYTSITVLPYSDYLGEYTRNIKRDGSNWSPSRKSSAKLTVGMPVFRVGADKCISFAPANLKYQNKSWMFHTNEYDRCYRYAKDVTSDYTQTGTFDLFGWAASGKAPEGQTATNPWETDTEATYGPGILDDGVDFASGWDWGQNVIGGTWRTLTYDEWEYMLGSSRFGLGYLYESVGYHISVTGFFIIPENFVDPKLSYNNEGSFSSNNNAYSYENWRKMQMAGAVFLPASLMRIGNSTIYDSHPISYYWTSTFHNDTYNKGPWYLYFSDDYWGIDYLTDASTGCAVRLVQDIPFKAAD